MDKRELLEQMPNRLLYLNLLISQAFLFVVGLVLYMFFLRKNLSIVQLYHLQDLPISILYGCLFAFCVILLDLVCMKVFPEEFFDDGGVNERLFRDLQVGQIALLALSVSLVEEWVFRAVLQNIVGLFWASIIFAIIHFRYFRHIVYATFIIALSLAFGVLYEWTNSLWSVITAHFYVNFILGVFLRYKLFVPLAWIKLCSNNDKF